MDISHFFSRFFWEYDFPTALGRKEDNIAFASRCICYNGKNEDVFSFQRKHDENENEGKYLKFSKERLNLPYIFTRSSLKSVITLADSQRISKQDYHPVNHTLPDGVTTCNVILRSLYTFHRATSAALRLLSQVSRVIPLRCIYARRFPSNDICRIVYTHRT